MAAVLIAYSTNAGSTQEVADAIGAELRKRGHTVDVRSIQDGSIQTMEPYDAVIVGAPMILGWQQQARSFVKKHRAALALRRVAYFCTMMSLTAAQQTAFDGIPLGVDPWLPKEPKNPKRLSIQENYATLNNYMKPITQAAPAVRPVSVGFFGGKLELFRLKWWQMLFVMVIIRAQPGDLRNWDFIEQWAGELDAQLFAAA
jgi:menaquinone-dependent protoporphyrinogen IX oxidase